MSKIQTIKRIWKTNKWGLVTACWNKLAAAGIFNRMSDEAYLKLSFFMCVGKKLHLDRPKTFNEKLQWLKLHDRKPEYINYVDKYAVRSYIRDNFGEDILVPLYGVWNTAEEIDFGSLPDRFVLKCTHDSGSICICKDRGSFDADAARKKLSAGLGRDMFYWGREWPYKEVPRRIIAEQLLQDADHPDDELIDYKLMCFNGKVKCSFTCSERFSGDGLKVTFFDEDWRPMPFTRHYPASQNPVSKPEHYSRMVQIAEKISAGHPFMRIDFYEVNHRLYFGEITLYPGNGMEEFSPYEWDKTLGSWIELPKEQI